MTSVLPSFILVFLEAQVSGFIFYSNLDNVRKYEKSFFLFEFMIHTATYSYKNCRRIKKCKLKFDRLQSYLLSYALLSFFSSLDFKFPDLFHFVPCLTFFF